MLAKLLIFLLTFFLHQIVILSMPERMTVDYIRGAVESLGLPHTETWRRATGMDQQDKSPAEERPTLIEYIPEANQTVILFTTEISRQLS